MWKNCPNFYIIILIGPVVVLHTEIYKWLMQINIGEWRRGGVHPRGSCKKLSFGFSFDQYMLLIRAIG
jgi:hypothetical protein